MSLPSEKILEQRRKITRFSNMIGADLETPNMYNPRMISLIVFGFIFASVIQFNGLYMAWPNALIVCQTLFFIPLMLQIFSRSVNRYLIKDEAINRELQTQLVNFHRNHEANLKYRSILSRKLDAYSSFNNMFFFLYAAAIHTPFIGAIASTAITGNFQLMAPIYLPYVDPSTVYGFIINAIVQLILTEVTFLALVALDFQFMLFSYQIASMIDMLILRFEEFGNSLASQRLKSRKTFKSLVQKHFCVTKQIPNSFDTKQTDRDKLVMLIKEYYEITKYTSLLFKEMRIPIFMTITSGSFALCLCALTMFSYSKVIGALGIVFSTFQTSSSCILVTFAVHQYEKFLDEIHGFPWYMLSKKDQKLFLQFLQSCHCYDEFELPMIGKVDMELFTTVINAGYSYFMFIWNLVDFE